MKQELTWWRAARLVVRERALNYGLTQGALMTVSVLFALSLPPLGIGVWTLGQVIFAFHVSNEGMKRRDEILRSARVKMLEHATQDVTAGELVRLTGWQHMRVRARLAFLARRRSFQLASLLGALLALVHLIGGEPVLGVLGLWLGSTLFFNAPFVGLAMFETLFPKLENRPELKRTLLLERKRRTVENVDGGLSLAIEGEDQARGGLTQARETGSLTQVE